MSRLGQLQRAGKATGGHRPWPRATVEADAWRAAIDGLAAGDWSLLSLWGEAGAVHMALLAQDGQPTVLTLACPEGRFPSVGALHAPAIRLERAIQDLFGLRAEGAADDRPWLDHGRWAGASGPAQPYAFLPAQGEGLHQIPVGPVHAGIIEPGHFRFTAYGETVVRLEARLGYVHRGLEGRMAGEPPERAARLAARASGDSTVAYSLAFARAVEAALGIVAAERAVWLRALMAELERLANHMGDIGAICNDASFSLMQAHCAVLREQVLRACAAAFGHRLMMDVVVPGGVAADIAPGGEAAIRQAMAAVAARFPLLVDLYDDTASLQDRTVATGRLPAELAQRFAAGGVVGRASGRAFDTRRALPYPPYDQLTFETALRPDGDVNARVWVRIEEVRQSLALVGQILDRLPAGPTAVALPARSGEGMAMVEGFRGDVLAWLRLERGQVARCHLRDPSWFHWPLLEACIEGNIVADFPLCNKSFNGSYAGVDL